MHTNRVRYIGALIRHEYPKNTINDADAYALGLVCLFDQVTWTQMRALIDISAGHSEAGARRARRARQLSEGG